ncbi:MAG: M23 family metallopeptidase [Clostridia bacterium]|nr:M23 family metallopeptidase [Clostridia bacterium]
MRRENRRKNLQGKSSMDKIILYAGIGVTVLAVIVFSLYMYSKSLNDDVKNSTMSLEQMANMASNATGNTESASTEIGKSVEESANELNTNRNNNQTNVTNTMNAVNTTNTINQTKNQTTTNATNTKKTTNPTNVVTNTKPAKTEEPKKELRFEKPVEGELVREYAKDNLIYSNTLEEWSTHLGIDLKADKTTVVKSAEAGTVKSIKNDPRYGLTIVIEHEDNFQTVYSNLLTSEFVVEGEKVEKGQSIGTVGNTAVFEIVDEPHLHFEVWKDSLPVDPSIYLK